nr:hypothetical protein [Saprospiraceae bacterium]
MVRYLTTLCSFFLMVTILHSADIPYMEKDPLLPYVSQNSNDPEVFVDTLIIVNPETFKKETYFTTRITNLKTDCDSGKRINFSLTAKQEKSKDIKSLSHNFRKHLLDKGWINSGETQVILRQDKLTIGGVDKPSKMHREVLNQFHQSLGEFHEVSLKVF